MKIIKVKIRLFILLLFFGSAYFKQNSPNQEILILVSFDGFRYDYMELIDTPNFDFLENNGVKAKSLQPVFPSFTFPNHYSIATGCYADKHQIIGNTFYDIKRKELYSYKISETVQDGSWYGGEPIWVTAKKNNLITATYFWIGSEAEIKGYRPDIYKNFVPMIEPYKKIDEMISWLNLPIKEMPRLILLYFDEPDHSGHIYGSLAEETLNQIKKMDDVLGYMLDSIIKIGFDNKVNLIVVSDHGMVDVDKNKIINLENYFPQNFEIYGEGPLVLLRQKSNARQLTDFKIPNVTIYPQNEIPKRFHYVNHNVPDYLLLADNGYLMYKNRDLNNDLPIVGMHGYDPEILDMHGIFYAYGPRFKQNRKIDSFELIHIYPLMCKILNINPYKGIDGDLKVLENIIN